MASEEEVAALAKYHELASREVVSVVDRVDHFEDHARRPATVTYESGDNTTLPPLASHAIYFVNASIPAPLSDDSATRLDNAIRGDGLVAAMPFRLELFYMPGADLDACVQHHRAERAARGDYTTQLDAVRNDQRPEDIKGVGEGDVFHASYRPGLPPSYSDRSGYGTCFNQLFFVSHSSSLEDGDGLLELVEYEPI